MNEPLASQSNIAARADRVSKAHALRGKPHVVAVREASLVLERGERVALLGPSGSGKSTLLHLLGCLERPTSGAIHVAGRAVATIPNAQLADFRSRHIGFVFQQGHLIPALTAAQNVSLPLRLQGAPRREALAQATLWLERVGLGHRLHHLPSQLSGGEQQRVGIARALAHRPTLVLADEPTGNLDAASRDQILALIAELNGAFDQTFLIATHDPVVAASCSRAITMRGGRIED